MQDIDFLPESYRDQYARRRNRLPRVALVVIFALMVLIPTLLQQQQLRKLRRQYRASDEHHQQAKLRQQRLREVRDKIESRSNLARMYTYLRHPWPRSRILQAVIADLPDSITLTEMTLLKRSESGGHGGSSPRKAKTPQAADTAELSPAQQALDSLRAHYDHVTLQVTLSGVTRDAPQLHEYLGKLDENLLLENPRLVSLSVSDEPRSFEFRAQIDIIPGYGQRGGPQPAEDHDAGHALTNL
jgi:hypothetical protein